MKPNTSMAVVLFLAVSVLVLARPSPAQEMKPQFYFIEDYTVKPSMAAQFEAAVKELKASVLTAFAWPWAMETDSTEDFHYFFSYPMAGLTDLDKAFSVFDGMIAKFGAQKWDALMKKFGSASESFKQFTATLTPELSYIPEKPRLKPEEMTYFYWGYCYVIPGKEKEFEAQFKKIAALFKAKNVDHGFMTWVCGIGLELPLYVYSESGKSAADFWLTSEKVMKIIDPEATKLWNETLTLMRKFEFKTGAMRPDLSYYPVKK